MAISLSNYEIELVSNPEVLLTKNKIIQKVYELFGELIASYQATFGASSLAIINDMDAKISRGENYKGLPYVILDYPRQFGKVDVFAIRTFFWWGNFFSITLQLGGVYQHKYEAAIEKAIAIGLFQGWYIGAGDDPWQHHFDSDNYTYIQQGKKYNIAQLSHLKMAKKIPLKKWDNAELFFKENFDLLIKVLSS